MATHQHFPPLWLIFGAAIAALLIAVWVWAEFACRSPAWQTVLSGSPSCTEFWLNRYQGLIGALATLVAGFLAYQGAVSEARRAERQAREVRKSALNDHVQRLCRDIDALKTAAGYVDKYLENFPSTAGGNNETYFNAFQTAHIKARDFISQSAVGAPDGYGARIHTVMTGIERLADRIKEQMASSGANYNSTVALFADEIKERVTGLRSIVKQMRDDIPRYEARLVSLRDELATLSS